MIKHITIIITLVVLFKGTKLFAQEKEFLYKNFTQEDGLPSNETYYVFEDSKKFLWFATDNGVVRYNGHRFEVFETPDKTVFQIKEDSKGRIWFFTYRAQFAYYEKGKIVSYRFNDILKNRITKLHIKDVYIDNDDNINLSSSLDSNYVINKDGNIIATGHYKDDKMGAQFRIDVFNNNNCFTKFTHRSDASDEIDITLIKENRKTEYHIPVHFQRNSQYGSICPDGKSVYFFYGSIILKLTDDGKFIYKKMPFTILTLKFHEGLLYAGVMNEGLFIFDEKFFPLEVDRQFKGRSVSSLLFDYEDGLWITTTDKGIFYVKNKLIKHAVPSVENKPEVSYSFQLNDTTLMYATPEGIFTQTGDKTEPFIKEKNGKVINITLYKKNALICCGSFNGSYNKMLYNLPQGIQKCMLVVNPNFKTCIYNNFIIGPSTLFVGKYESAFLSKHDYYRHRYDTPISSPPILLNVPAKIFMDRQGILWGGTQDGLYKSIAPYDTLLLENNSPLLSKGIDFITQLQNNLLAISTRPGNIVLMNQSNIIGSVSEKDGLLSNKIRYILPVKNQLWVATHLGISVIEFSSFHPLTYTIKNIDKKDGLFNFTINHLSEYNGSIIAATTNGLYYIENPDIVLRQKNPLLPFSISNINYYKGDTSGVSSISLPYSRNRAIIKYKAISYNSFESIQYRYRFTSGDTAWHTTNSNELVLENLEPGTYNLEVKAVIPAQQRTSQLQMLSIIVQKPWWQNNWLRLLSLLTVSFSIFLFVKRRIKRIREEEKNKTDLNAKLSELEQTALRSQMNPHFIFNCLTSIQQLIVSGNKVDANEYLVKFSRLIRKTLDMSSRPFISVTEEKNYLEEYLTLEQLRMAGRFDFNITSEETIDSDSTFIPNMMIQPVVENCIRHGIKTLQNRRGKVSVVFKPANKSITCIVTDNGAGRGSSAVQNSSFTEHKSYGMEIVRRRLETFSEFNVDESGIEIKDLYDKEGLPSGTEVILHLPYKINV